MSRHEATVRWERQDGEVFTDDKYSRSHTWEFDGGTIVPASSAPSVVPLPYSVETNVDPEEALIASVSSCHMLFFLAFAAKQRFVVDQYRDNAFGLMEKNERGRYAFSKVTLRPEITFSSDKQPTQDQMKKLHALSHDHCFIANSLNFDVVVAAPGSED